MTPSAGDDLAAFFDALAEASGAAIRPWFRTGVTVGDKASAGGPLDPVTEADREAERAIRALIRARFPDHGVVGEEFGPENAGASHVWVIDPIDGTKGFICGLPTWGTLVGLMADGRPVFGMMDQPHVGDRFTGDGRTAHARDRFGGRRRLAARSGVPLDQAILATTSPALFREDEIEAYRRLEGACRLARYGGDCYAYAMLAAGQIDLVCEAGLNTYDIMPLIPIIEGAGGVVTTWEGGLAQDGGRILAAGSRELHAAAMALLADG